MNGRKRHLLVDTLGLVCKAHVTPADISDRDGAVGLLRRLDWRRFPRLRYGWVDQGYRGEFLAQVKQAFGVRLQVVQRPDGGRRGRWLPPGAEPPQVPAFQVVPRRWVVERSFAWLGRSRRLARDGVMTDSRGDYLRLGPAPYLADAQLEAAAARVLEVSAPRPP